MRPREVYLGPWRSLAVPPEDLRRAAGIAVRIAPVSRALAWGRIFPCFTQAGEPGAQAVQWLSRVLHAQVRDGSPG